MDSLNEAADTASELKIKRDELGFENQADSIRDREYRIHGEISFL